MSTLPVSALQPMSSLGPTLALEPTEDELDELARRCIAFAHEQRAITQYSPGREPNLQASPPAPRLLAESPVSLESLLEELSVAAKDTWNTASPWHMGFVPGGGLPAAALGDYLALNLNRFVGIRTKAPLLAGIEESVTRWMCDLFDYPPDAAGILTTGGSMSILTALIAAREARLSRADGFREAVIYCTAQTHLALAKAARAAGFPDSSLKLIAVDERYRLSVDALKAAIAADRAAGRQPFMVVASAGTTNTGAIDPLMEICRLCRAEGLWVHADAAYGGFFIMTDRGREALDGLGECDSITLDPHKGLFLPYGTGALLVRSGQDLVSAYGATADYLRDDGEADGIASFSDMSLELSRELRGLRVWLPLRLHSLSAFRSALDEKIDLARHAYTELIKDPRIELIDFPQLSTVVFRARVGDNTALLRRINATGRALLSSTLLEGSVVIRICVLSFRTHREHVDAALEAIRQSL